LASETSMCRYVAYLGSPISLDDLFFRPSNSLIHQSAEAMESPTHINADGFGVGWYHLRENTEPAVFKDVSPAWNNANLRSIADKISSTCILAHVRAAKRNDLVNRANCHPFERFGLLWMHNGDIPGRGRLHRRIAALSGDDLVARIQGNTDSELAFTLFLTHLRPPLERRFTLEELGHAMRRTMEQILCWYDDDRDTRLIALNFCVSDGRVLVATRFARNIGEGKPAPSLHCCAGRRFVCDDGGPCRMEEPNGTGRASVMLASEVLFDGEGWNVVPENSLVLVGEDFSVELSPLAA